MYESDSGQNENEDIGNIVAFECHKKVMKDINKYKEKIESTLEETKSILRLILQQGKNYVELYGYCKDSGDETFRVQCVDTASNLEKEFNRAFDQFTTASLEISVIEEVLRQISDIQPTLNTDVNFQTLLEKVREDVSRDFIGDSDLKREWEEGIAMKLNTRSLKDQIEEQFNAEGLAVIQEESELICPVLQMGIAGKAMKNSLCGHIYSVEGFQHLMQKLKKKKKCPVAGCPKSIQKSSVISIEV